jgi:hypothetical protein
MCALVQLEDLGAMGYGLWALGYGLLVLLHPVDDRLSVGQDVQELVAPGLDACLIATRQCRDEALLALCTTFVRVSRPR